ncbi:hypothetical protein D9M71_441310 [compost metagenome]
MALALCSARPACFSSVCGSRPSRGAQARPMEPVMLISWLSTNSGLLRMSRICSATFSPRCWLDSSRNTANSLLAKRARVTFSPRLPFRRRARRLSSLSPVWWPRLSLIRLKLSISTSSRLSGRSPPPCRRSLRALMKKLRLARPVRLSR